MQQSNSSIDMTSDDSQGPPAYSPPANLDSPATLNAQSDQGSTAFVESGQRGPSATGFLTQRSSVSPGTVATNPSRDASGIMAPPPVDHPSYYLHDFRLPAQGATHALQTTYGAARSAPSAVYMHAPSPLEPVSATTPVSPSSVNSGSTPIPVLSAPAPTSAQLIAAHLPASTSPGTSATTSGARKERVQCPLCSSDFGRVQELNRHQASVHRGKPDGPLWACCGVPIEDARSKYGMSEEQVAASMRGQYNGQAMVGGCWSANFNRRDTYARHLRDQYCVGDPYGEYHLGNRLLG
ncbi:hypothetical protein C8T65DRAFT_644817 [Cerioporus squamosus]|nr:hypothetical protein C8T65DRAFT_644817 [Cerioporus squamosus]